MVANSLAILSAIIGLCATEASAPVDNVSFCARAERQLFTHRSWIIPTQVLAGSFCAQLRR